MGVSGGFGASQRKAAPSPGRHDAQGVEAAGDTLVLSGLPEPLALAEEKLLRG